MKDKLRLTNIEDGRKSDRPQHDPPPPLPFKDASSSDELVFPTNQPDRLVDDVLRSLDELSISLDDLRREIESLESDDDPSPAA